MKKKGMYYRADEGDVIDAFCYECAKCDEVIDNYSVWEDLGTDKCECGICGAELTN